VHNTRPKQILGVNFGNRVCTAGVKQVLSCSAQAVAPSSLGSNRGVPMASTRGYMCWNGFLTPARGS